MAELASLGLACSIIQLVDFGSKLFSKARKIANSPHSVGDQENELVTIAKDLKALVHNLEQDPARDSTLNELRRACCGVADELIRIIEDLKARHPEPGGRWASFKQAVSLVRKEKEIQDLEMRLQKLQAQISTHLITTLSSQQSSTMVYINRLIERTTRLEMNTANTINTLRLEILDALKRRPEDDSSLPLTTVGDKLADLSRSGSSLEKQQKILQSLTFDAIDWRYSNIKKEHEETFQWIFEDPETEFMEWLKSRNGIYWIEGKAGSGKSTLMKYLVNIDRTRVALEEWAGDRQLSMASYFFWAAGTPLQRSQEGLLRTILFQVLRKYPGLISVVCPDRWDAQGGSYPDSWQYGELKRTLDAVAKETLLHTCFCFFVDGMDEFPGDQRALVQLMKDVAVSPSIKLCISSRPWNVFINAFEGRVPQLKLETLTKGDIQKYVEDKLNSALLSGGHDPEEQRQIVIQIASRARGVCLWVYLVVDSLLRGLEEGDDIRDMRRRLDSLPDDLEEFFKRILSNVDKVYREQTAKIFLVMIEAGRPLPALAFYFLEQEEIDKEYALNARLAEMSAEDIDQISENMKKRINARCRDLLETKKDQYQVLFKRYQVDFLHRTVRDFFLETTAIDDILKPQMRASFEPCLSLCRMILALSKTLPPGEMKLNLEIGRQMMEYALKFETKHIRENRPHHEMVNEFNLLDELQRVWKKQSYELLHPGWIGRAVDLRDSIRHISDRNFIGFSVEGGLLLYLRGRLDREPKLLNGTSGPLYLLYAYHGVVAGRSAPNAQGQRHGGIEILQFLLEQKDLHANVPVGSETAWILCVKAAQRACSSTVHAQQEYICDVLKLFLRNGADPNVRWSDFGDSRPAINKIQNLFPAHADEFENAVNTKRKSAHHDVLPAPDPRPLEPRKKSPMRAWIHRLRSKD
ncbi:uncharacterized protein BJX67DRAFT_376398 [Aspergillus lucknowensis]|uniref:NACHT domain-containing protein n=1 Tax=Aspergillus lucknowensis TaxID=176173 RepID=A0ABR4M7K6_9EURO